MPHHHKLFFYLSMLVIILILISSSAGLLSSGLYDKETLNWQIQSIGQDYVNLFVVLPALLVSGVLILKKKDSGFPVWAGVTLYLVYTYTIYCFDVHFNRYFLFYCLILGLCFYLLLFFSYTIIRYMGLHTRFSQIHKFTGYYFLIISLLFYFLWLSEIIPACIHNYTPQSLKEVGLPTNAVHVIDLAIFLPGTFISGILLFRKHTCSILLAPVLLTFFILMDITIAALTIMMNLNGLETNLSIALIMGGLSIFSTILLVLHLKNTDPLQ